MEDTLKQLTDKKRELDALQPLPQELQQELEGWEKVELTYNSNAIEGNTLTAIETAEIIERGIDAVIPSKPLKDQLEAINHAKAVELIKRLSQERKGHQFITEHDIKAIHKHILTGIDDGWAGKYRQISVSIRGADIELPSPNRVPQLMNDFIYWLQGQQETHPVIVAADAHFKLVSIHPFIDGNGRTARLLMNLILIMHGYPMAIIRNDERTQYIESVYQGQKHGEMSGFYSVVEEAVDRSLDFYLRSAKGEPIIHPMKRTEKSAGNGSATSLPLLRIGDLARSTGEEVHTIRFWTQEGLLSLEKRTDSGHYLYSPAMIERAKEIRRLQDVEGVNLQKIKERLKDI